MNKIQKLAATINANKGPIIRRTLVVGVSVIGVTLVAGLIKVRPTEKAAELVEDVAQAVKKAAE